MHELSLAEEVLHIVASTAAREQARQVRSVRLVVGALAGVEPDALRFAWEAIRDGSVASEAPLELVAVPATGTCADCGDVSPAWDRLEVCPACGGLARTITGGTMFTVDSLEIA